MSSAAPAPPPPASSSSSAAGSQQQQQQQQIDVTDLSAPQLQQVRQQLEAELQHLASSYAQLKAAHAKFRGCVEAIEALQDAERKKKKEEEGEKTRAKQGAQQGEDGQEEGPGRADDALTLVPLTSSLYVRAKLTDTERVLVDVGTGYFVEKPLAAAKASYEARISTLTTNLESLQQAVTKKEDNVRVVRELLAVRAAQAQQQQQGQQQQQQNPKPQGRQ